MPRVYTVGKYDVYYPVTKILPPSGDTASAIPSSVPVPPQYYIQFETPFVMSTECIKASASLFPELIEELVDKPVTNIFKPPS